MVIGLEVHSQLSTASKIFCGCSTAYGASTNVHTCPVCPGLPGSLPVVNKPAVDYPLMLALATHCQVASQSRFPRKNYFCPDLPKGYGISQFEHPLAEYGWIDIETDSGTKRIGLRKVHIEEDAGKSIHNDAEGLSNRNFKSCGVLLIEIVSEPDAQGCCQGDVFNRKISQYNYRGWGIRPDIQ